MSVINAYCLQHVAFEGPGMIEPVLQERGINLITIQLFEQQKCPANTEVDYLIVMGGPMDLEDEDQYPWLADEKRLIKATIDAGKPVLGICLGAQLIAHVLEESVYPAKQQEIGWYSIHLTEAAKDHELTSSWAPQPTVFHWHSNTFDLPEGAIHLASTESCANQAFILNENIIGLQFHLEVARPQVQLMIDNWGRYNESGPHIQEPGEMLERSDASDQTQRMLHQLIEFWIE